MDGFTVSKLEEYLHSTTNTRIFVDRVRSNGRIIEIGAIDTLHAGDLVVLSTVDVAAFHQLEETGLVEAKDDDLLNFPIEEIEVVVTSDTVADKTLDELGRRSESREIFIKDLVRSGHQLPILPNTAVQLGDVIRIQGPRPLVESAIPQIGYPERSTPQTDMVTVGLGIAAGALIGLPAITMDNIPLSLTTSVGAMLIGLIIGWRRSKSPTFGRIPSGAQWFFESVGLAAFVAVVGINAGPGFVGRTGAVWTGTLWRRHCRNAGPPDLRNAIGPLSVSFRPGTIPRDPNWCADYHRGCRCSSRGCRIKCAPARLHDSLRNRQYLSVYCGSDRGCLHGLRIGIARIMFWRYSAD